MRVLIIGSTGFIGGRIARALRAHDIEVFESTRQRDPAEGRVFIDFTQPINVARLASKLRGIDVVVNAVGIIRERGPQTFEAIHARGPQALFEACKVAGVSRVVQISALGAGTRATRYFASKQRASDALESLDLDWTIVEPSLAFGLEGRSATLFSMLAVLPVVPLPGDGSQCVQPVHVDDVVEGMVRLVIERRCVREKVPFVGPRPVPLHAFLTALRDGMGMPAGRLLRVHRALVSLGAHLGKWNPRSLMDPDAMKMLEAGNCGDAGPLQDLLGRPARDITTFIPRERAADIRRRASLQWLLPLLRWSIAFVWIWTAIVSFGLFPASESYELLAQVGVRGTLATMLLYGAAALDLVLGIATLAMRRRAMLWPAQILVILTFTIMISIWIPGYWLHPFAPIAKNVPMIAGIVVLWMLEKEEETWTT